MTAQNPFQGHLVHALPPHDAPRASSKIVAPRPINPTKSYVPPPAHGGQLLVPLATTAPLPETDNLALPDTRRAQSENDRRYHPYVVEPQYHPDRTDEQKKSYQAKRARIQQAKTAGSLDPNTLDRCPLPGCGANLAGLSKQMKKLHILRVAGRGIPKNGRHGVSKAALLEIGKRHAELAMQEDGCYQCDVHGCTHRTRRFSRADIYQNHIEQFHVHW